jgi:hypothetical protein
MVIKKQTKKGDDTIKHTKPKKQKGTNKKEKNSDKKAINEKESTSFQPLLSTFKSLFTDSSRVKFDIHLSLLSLPVGSSYYLTTNQ